MSNCFFVSDLHGRRSAYTTLFHRIAVDAPGAVFLGGDLLPNAFSDAYGDDFLDDFLFPALRALREGMGATYPRIFVIPGNDDLRSEEQRLIDEEPHGTWIYVHNRCVSFEQTQVYGYACVPPTPFRLKDWEKYDVSQHVDPGCVSPEEGIRSIPVTPQQVRYESIAEDLRQLAGTQPLDRAIFLCHAPPYQTTLDRAALDGRMIDHVPLDVHVGSIALRRFIEQRQPLLTLHGHIHESARLTGAWRDQIGRTHCFSAAHDGPELALVQFDPDNLSAATRTLI